MSKKLKMNTDMGKCLRLAVAVGKAKLSGDQAAIDRAERALKSYEDLMRISDVIKCP